ncbi:hypothetical protein [Lysobacter tyrosinilyticus]
MKYTILKSCSAFAGLLAGLLAVPAFAAENPMDNAGIQHNLYLGCLQDIGADSTNSLALLVDKCGYNPGISRDEFIKQGQPIIDMDPMQPLAEKMSPYRDRYSAYEFSFFERIDGVVHTAKDLPQAEAMFAELEAEAIQRVDAKTHSGANVLAGLSTARHSLRYWTEYAGKSDATGKRRPWWHWVVIGVADVAGGVLGAETGPGAIGTAAAASSAANGLIKELDP